MSVLQMKGFADAYEVAGGCSYCFCLGVFKIISGDSFVVWYRQVDCWPLASVEKPSHCTGHPKIAFYYFLLGPLNSMLMGFLKRFYWAYEQRHMG